MKQLLQALRARRLSHLAVVNLRILLGFAFVPAGLKKVLRQPFTDPQNTGPFHDFLHAFFATGVFYPFVGAVQLVIAVLLMTQTFAPLGAALALPVMVCITAFCWSTGVVPTAVVTTLMLCGTLALLVWDVERFGPLLRPEGSGPPEVATATAAVKEPPAVDTALWRACGTAILGFYGLTCLLHGGVYRPKGVDYGAPAFYVLLLLPLFPLVTLFLEQRRRS
ncbi:MAG: DoxX family membrane protein [Acidobacteriota bacterium]